MCKFQNLVTTVVLGISIMVALFGLTTRVSAATINVDFNKAGGTAGTYVGLGAYTGDTGTYWNALTVSGSVPVTTGKLTASDGVTTTPVTFTLGAADPDDTSPGSPCPLATALMSDYAASSGSFSFAINGLIPGESYQLYLYSQNTWGGCNTQFTVGTATANAANGSHLTSFTPGENYATLSSLTADNAGTLSGSVANIEGAAIFNGVQIVGPVPEPGMLALLGLSGLCLLRRRRT